MSLLRAKWRAAVRWFDAFFLRTRMGAQLSSLVMFAAVAYSGYLVVAELSTWAPVLHDTSRHLSDKAVVWVMTLSVFYGVFLEERQALSKTWNVAEADVDAARVVHEVDARQGASLLCVGLLAEAVIGFVDLGRLANATPSWDLHTWLCFFFIPALLWICSRHICLHGLPWRHVPSRPVPLAGTLRTGRRRRPRTKRCKWCRRRRLSDGAAPPRP